MAALPNEIIITMIDLTARKRAETEILELNAVLEERVRQRTVELEIANRELESFSYSVSHDLRAPLRAISGFGTALRADYSEQLDEDGRNYLERMLNASNRMSLLIDDLLRFSRLSRTAVVPETVDMNALFNEVWSELHEANIGSNSEIRIDPLPPCQADRGLLKQVVFNLLNNAAKFSRNSQPSQIHVFCQQLDHQPVYGVRDNGVGFDMGYADKLFGVFQRLHRSEEFEGTGVGLALCRRVIERHGGRIWAESSPGKGAVFYFTLGHDEVDQLG
jgi:light-regulated signal transduction histidine kinase (bacteriophytochrome)